MRARGGCKGCKYAVCLSGLWCCDYLKFAGHRRPCPPGKDCTVRDDGKQGRGHIDSDWARELYDAGMLDNEIAAEFGVTAVAVFRWRQRNGLPANGQGGKQIYHLPGCRGPDENTWRELHDVHKHQ